jgi:hypothetical protein
VQHEVFVKIAAVMSHERQLQRIPRPAVEAKLLQVCSHLWSVCFPPFSQQRLGWQSTLTSSTV